MFIKTKLTERDFINATFVILYKRMFVRIFTGILILSIITFLISSAANYKKSISDIGLPLIALIFLPVFTYVIAKKNFASNKRISETIEYSFDENYLNVKGESFNSQSTWDKIYKVTQTKNWLFIYQSRQLANPIPKRDVWEGEMNNLKTFLDNHGVKNNL